MKTMTCSQLGGACELPLVGEDPNEIRRMLIGRELFEESA